MNVDQIEMMIYQLESNLDLLKHHLTEIQQQCNHQFEGDSYSQKCVKCHSVEVLYY